MTVARRNFREEDKAGDEGNAETVSRKGAKIAKD
jgi:hypothetical protein